MHRPERHAPRSIEIISSSGIVYDAQRGELPPSSHEADFPMHGRWQVRRIPIAWVHPKNARGEYTPLQSRNNYTQSGFKELLEIGVVSSQEKYDEMFMPDFAAVPQDEMGVCLYESISEGTPVSPIFSNTPRGIYQLVEYCSEHPSEVGSTAKELPITWWAGRLFELDLVLVDMVEKRITLKDSATETPQGTTNSDPLYTTGLTGKPISVDWADELPQTTRE